MGAACFLLYSSTALLFLVSGGYDLRGKAAAAAGPLLTAGDEVDARACLRSYWCPPPRPGATKAAAGRR